MSLSLGTCGRLMKQAVDKLSSDDCKDRIAVYGALGAGIEEYVESLLTQLTITVPPLAGLGIAPGGLSPAPTLPGPAPVTIPPGSLK